MVSGCGQTERCYIQIRVDDGMRIYPSRASVLVVVGRPRPRRSHRLARRRRWGTVSYTLGLYGRIVGQSTLGSQYSKQRVGEKD